MEFNIYGVIIYMSELKLDNMVTPDGYKSNTRWLCDTGVKFNNTIFAVYSLCAKIHVVVDLYAWHGNFQICITIHD